MKNAIKIFGLVVLFIFIAPQVYSQKCKFEIDKKDQITGEIVKKTNFLLMGKRQWGMVEVAFNKVANTFFIDTYIYVGGFSGDVISPTEEFIIKLANGKIITKNTNEKIKPIAFSNGNGSRFELKLYFSDEELREMANSNPTFMRFSISGKTYDIEITSKDAKNIANSINCILQ